MYHNTKTKQRHLPVTKETKGWQLTGGGGAGGSRPQVSMSSSACGAEGRRPRRTCGTLQGQPTGGGGGGGQRGEVGGRQAARDTQHHERPCRVCSITKWITVSQQQGLEEQESFVINTSRLVVKTLPQWSAEKSFQRPRLDGRRVVTGVTTCQFVRLGGKCVQILRRYLGGLPARRMI